MHVRIDNLIGSIYDDSQDASSNGMHDANGEQNLGTRAPSLYAVGQLCAFGEVLGLPARAPIVSASPSGCTWGSVISFPLKVHLLLP